MSTLLIAAFWCCIFLLFYSYLGYGIILFILTKIKRIYKPSVYAKSENGDYPSLSFVVAAYNESDFINEKIDNSLALNYPREKIEFVFVTDGSTDNTPEIVGKYDKLKLLHQKDRKGKIAAVNRAVEHTINEIIIFSDANAILNKEALTNIVRHYNNTKVGAVAGEKRIIKKSQDSAAGAGEGIYWKYESQLKKWDSELYSVVGAAGELFSVRSDLYEPIPEDTIIEDFYLTMKIAQKGYRVIYEPNAYATESSSLSVKEELKRKIRIAAGGIQAIVRLRGLLNIFRYGVLSFQYISHRVLRWTLAPLALSIIFITNIILALQGIFLYQLILVFQFVFYGCAFIGFLLEERDLKFKSLFIPYYFFVMNYAVYKGFFRYLKGSQTVLWERARRA